MRSDVRKIEKENTERTSFWKVKTISNTLKSVFDGQEGNQGVKIAKLV